MKVDSNTCALLQADRTASSHTQRWDIVSYAALLIWDHRINVSLLDQCPLLTPNHGLHTYFAGMDNIQGPQMGQDKSKELCWEIEQVGHRRVEPSGNNLR